MFTLMYYFLLTTYLFIGLWFYEDLKFLKISTPDCHFAFSEIKSEINESICCSSDGNLYEATENICFYSNNHVCDTLKSPLAIILPFAILIIPSLLYIQVRSKEYGLIIGKMAVLLIFLIAYRTLVLYHVLNFIQDVIQKYFQFSTPQDEGSCWFAKYRKHGDCGTEFDFSDHVVLFMVQYIFVAWVFIKILRSLEKEFKNDQIFSKSILFYGSYIIASLCVLLPSACMFGTVTYFHTFYENITALWIVIAFVELPFRHFEIDSLISGRDSKIKEV